MALEAILPPDDFSYYEDTLQGELSIHPDLLDSDILVRVQSAEASARPASPPEFRIRFLPPVQIKFKLIRDYPEREPPEFWFECRWLTEGHRGMLERRLMKLWREAAEGSVVLYLWHQDLANGGIQERCHVQMMFKKCSYIF